MNRRSLQNLRPGGPGRKKGQKNKATVAMKDAAQLFLEDPIGKAKLLDQYRRGKLHPSVLIMFHHYAWGRPAEVIHVNPGESKPWVVVLPAGHDDGSGGVRDGL